MTLSHMDTEASIPAEPAVAEPAEPVVETTAPETVAPEVTAPETPAIVDPFEEYGGKDNVAAAHRLYEASRSEDGVIQLFLEAGRNLGLGLKDMQALFEIPGAEETEPVDLDEPMTRGEFQAEIRRQQEEQAQRQATSAQESARRAVQSAMTSLDLDPKDPATAQILNHGDQYINGDFSPENVLNAVRRGQADYHAEMERQAKAYLAKKAAAAASVPSAPAGAAAPTADPEPEPQNVAEAIKRARRQMGIGS